MNPDLTIEEPVGFLVVPQAEWAKHPWLCTLNSGSDTEGDSAYFWNDLTDAEFASFSSIVFQVSDNGQSWRPAISAAGSFFPSRGWAQAQIGFFREPLLPTSEPYGMRALFPENWQAPLAK